MSSSPNISHVSQQRPANSERSRPRPSAEEPHAVALTEPLSPPRDVFELMLLHGDCGYLLDLWAL